MLYGQSLAGCSTKSPDRRYSFPLSHELFSILFFLSLFPAPKVIFLENKGQLLEYFDEDKLLKEHGGTSEYDFAFPGWPEEALYKPNAEYDTDYEDEEEEGSENPAEEEGKETQKEAQQPAKKTGWFWWHHM